MDYRRLIPSKKLRTNILQMFSFIDDATMVKFQYRVATGQKLDLKNPSSFNEKLQWYKVFYRNPLMTVCADKYGVREYVKSKGLQRILNECYGVYDNIEEINFNKLPNKFVLKTTNGSGTNVFCENKKSLDTREVIKKLEEWLKPIKKPNGREWAYENIKPRIIAEKFLEDHTQNGSSDLVDYKFFCFNGSPKFIQVDLDRHKNHKRNLYDTDWNQIDVTYLYPQSEDKVEPPENFKEMLEVASTLAADFPFVRVDLYNFG